jgi:hypothetical protein
MMNTTTNSLRQPLKTRLLTAGAIMAFFAVTHPTSANAQIEINVTPTLAPNAFGSPSYDQWVTNAIYAEENGLTSYGDPTSPSYYTAASGTIPLSSNIVTDFNSWLGNANPSVTYGAAYAGELGNRLSFGLDIQGNGQLISISELSFTATSTDSGDSLGFSYNTGDYDYSSSYVGIIYGADGRGGADETFVTSGPSTQLVNEIVSRGSGNADAVYSTDPGATDQDKIDNFIAGAEATTPGSFDFTGTYTLTPTEGDAVDGSATVVIATPEPASWTLAFLCMGIFVYIRRRSARVSTLVRV